MQREDYNNDFFSYQGRISRKNYVINMFILLAVFGGLSFIKLERFEPYITYKFLYSALVFMVSMTKFVALMAMLSVVYRRISDFTNKKVDSYKLVMKKIFILFFVLPILYDYCFRFFINIIPPLQYTLDITTIFILYPLAFLTTIILCFVKSE
ncbi:MAG: hypothetical protein IJY61_01910 [Candidatus Gastranaerophilales bacterium]|nr:hypothetical protein [Candidatus Gastranaerophilales bacterium]